MKIRLLFYNLIISLFVLPIIYTFGWLNKTLAKNLKGRWGLVGRARLFRQKDEKSPLVLIHVSSAGEFEQVRPLIGLIKKESPSTLIGLTFFSSSGLRFFAKTDCQDLDFVDFCPLDFYLTTKKYLEILHPTALIFVRYDLWPNLIHNAAALSVPLFLIDATMHKKSLMPLAVIRSFYQDMFSHFTYIMTIAKEDQELYQRVFLPLKEKTIVTTGDTKYDRVLELRQKPPGSLVSGYTFNQFYLVAGSTWQKDEEYLMKAYRDLKEIRPELQLILVPHEIERSTEIEAKAQLMGLKIKKLDQFKKGESIEFDGIILVDLIGVLVDLYGIANIAYVGGAINARVHNVIEPAALGVPVVFGSNYQNSKEAIGLIKSEGAQCFNSYQDCVDILGHLVTNIASGKKIGQRAFEYVESNAGASEKCYYLIKQTV